MDLLKEIDAMKHGKVFQEIEQEHFNSILQDDHKHVPIYENNNLYPDDNFDTDRNSEPEGLKQKRAWEVIDWRKPKRAWEMLDSWKGIPKFPTGGTGKRSDEKLIDIPVQHFDSQPWMTDDISYDASEYEKSGYDSSEYDKRSWEESRVSWRCSCCSEKVTSVCCLACRALTTYKRNYNGGANDMLRNFTCRCCKSVWFQTDECCSMCRTLLRKFK